MWLNDKDMCGVWIEVILLCNPTNVNSYYYCNHHHNNNNSNIKKQNNNYLIILWRI